MGRRLVHLLQDSGSHFPDLGSCRPVSRRENSLAYLSPPLETMPLGMKSTVPGVPADHLYERMCLCAAIGW